MAIAFIRRPILICYSILSVVSSVSRIHAQTPDKDSLAILTGYAAAITFYHHSLMPETRLFRGGEYAEYAYAIHIGHPFFDIDHMQKGSVYYDGLHYDDILLIYDLVRGQVVINDPYNAYKISLLNDRLDTFTIGSHLFIHLRDSANGPGPGFYELLYEGKKVRMLKREWKTIQEDPSATTADSKEYINHSVSYYLRIANRNYIVNSKRSLLRAMKDKRAAVRKFIRGLGPDLQTDKDQVFARAAAWYDRNTQ
ncbi:MAG: hypothetical protein Q8927_07645 [Bacteroidota bacterium]|nr:hypothetical protein [Bacteroidota bacterium]MDP4216060.1 hypothetical protein [Bacteroidota bacterium]